MSADASDRCLSRRAVLHSVAAGAGALAVPGAAGAERSDSTRVRGPSADEIEAFLDDRLPGQLDEYDLAGATVSVVAGGECRVAKGYGLADVAAERPVRADETLFRIGSVSKAVTATAVVHAAERGYLALDDDVSEYVDVVPDGPGGPITFEHLLTHSAGFDSRTVGTMARDAADLSPLGDELAANLPPRVRPPGDVASYSNWGAGLAGHALGRAAGTTYADYVRDHVLDPLGMERTAVAQPPPGDLADATAREYAQEGGEFRDQGFAFVRARPAGAMSATATDMARFAIAHLRGGRLDGRRVLDRSSVDAMHEPRFANHPAVHGLGLGFYELDRKGVRIVGHTGNTANTHSLLALFPERDVGLFVAYNTDGGDEAYGALLDAFVEEFFDPVPAPALEPDGRPARADALTGWYRVPVAETGVDRALANGFQFEARIASDGALVTDRVGGDTRRWIEVAPLVFRAADGRERLAFRERDGEITHAARDSLPMFAFERLSKRETPTLQAAVFALATLTLLSGVLRWPAGAAWRRLRGGHGETGAPETSEGRWSRPRLARLVAGAAGVGLLGGPVALAAVVAADPQVLLVGFPAWSAPLFALPLIGLAATLASAGFAATAWRDGYWSLLERVHYTLVALAALAFAWLLAYWNLLWPSP